MGFDLPEVAPIFEEYVAAQRLSSAGVTFHAGSFFDRSAAQSRRRHDGPHPARLESRGKEDAHSQRPTKQLPSGGALIVYESMIDDDRSKNAFGLLMSLNMLIETPGGFDYTGADCWAG